MVIFPLTLTVFGGIIFVYKISKIQHTQQRLVADRRAVEDTVDCLAENIRAVSVNK